MDEQQFERLIRALVDIKAEIRELRHEQDRRASRVAKSVRRAVTDRVSSGGRRA